MDIKVKKLEEMLQQARSKIEDIDALGEVQESGMISGAHNIPRGLLEFQLKPSEGFPADTPILVYCAVGARAALAGVTLKELGFTNVKNLGGFKDWQDASQ